MTAMIDHTWWRQRQTVLWSTQHTDPSMNVVGMSAQVLEVLDEVAAAFAEVGGNDLGWRDPHLMPDGSVRDSYDEEYSRVTDRDKYRILDVRIEAWFRVLVGRGWAPESQPTAPAQVAWVRPPLVPPQAIQVMSPFRTAAQPLVLARTDAAADPDSTMVWQIGMGDPAYFLDSVPDCGCDACDCGSGDLIEALDSTIVSIVDGSVQVRLDRRSWSLQTSFHAEGSQDRGWRRGPVYRLRAEPWADNWTAMSLTPPV